MPCNKKKKYRIGLWGNVPQYWLMTSVKKYRVLSL